MYSNNKANKYPKREKENDYSKRRLSGTRQPWLMNSSKTHDRVNKKCVLAPFVGPLGRYKGAQACLAERPNAYTRLPANATQKL